MLQVHKGEKGQSRDICKNYRVAEHPLVLRIGDWLCVLPAITLVVDKSKKVYKAASLDW